jgi:hypothetical protein
MMKCTENTQNLKFCTNIFYHFAGRIVNTFFMRSIHEQTREFIESELNQIIECLICLVRKKYLF